MKNILINLLLLIALAGACVFAYTQFLDYQDLSQQKEKIESEQSSLSNGNKSKKINASDTESRTNDVEKSEEVNKAEKAREKIKKMKENRDTTSEEITVQNEELNTTEQTVETPSSEIPQDEVTPSSTEAVQPAEVDSQETQVQ